MNESVLVLKPDWLAAVALWLGNSYFSIPCPSGQAGMKRKQKSCQNEPFAGRFDGPHTRFDQKLLLKGLQSLD